MIEIEFVVWEFVRLMVALEDAKDRNLPGGVYAAWQAPWQEIDNRLTKLGGSDAEGFAQLMMNQTISVSCGRPQHLSDAIDALENVIDALKVDIAHAKDDAEQEAELSFELAELVELVDRLRAIDPAMISDD
ncbi:MAG TPA: hypothetical protein EYQ81_05420 [Sneathiellales bacterium]|nr:hypothetical protein [Sneathiellales bacterium]